MYRRRRSLSVYVGWPTVLMYEVGQRVWQYAYFIACQRDESVRRWSTALYPSRIVSLARSKNRMLRKALESVIVTKLLHIGRLASMPTPGLAMPQNLATKSMAPS